MCVFQGSKDLLVRNYKSYLLQATQTHITHNITRRYMNTFHNGNLSYLNIFKLLGQRYYKFNHPSHRLNHTCGGGGRGRSKDYFTGEPTLLAPSPKHRKAVKVDSFYSLFKYFWAKTDFQKLKPRAKVIASVGFLPNNEQMWWQIHLMCLIPSACILEKESINCSIVLI